MAAPGASLVVHARLVCGLVVLGFGVPNLWTTRGVGSRVAIVALAILLSEIAHASLSRMVAAPRASNPRPNIAICLGGPCLGAALAALALACVTRMHLPKGVLEAARDLLRVSGGWAAMNLLPILPLAGGTALRAIFASEKGAESACRMISASLALAIALPTLEFGFPFPGLVLVAISVHNALGLHTSARQEAVGARLVAAYAAIDRGDAAATIVLCKAVLCAVPSPSQQRDAIRLLAYANATSGGWMALLKLLEASGDSVFADEELAKYENAARELRHVEAAARIRVIRARRTAVASVGCPRSRSH